MRFFATLAALGMVALAVPAKAGDGLFFSDDSGPYCREYTRNVMVGNRMQEGYGTACLQPDGSWQIRSEGVKGQTIAAPVTQYEYIPAASVVRTVEPSRVIVQRPIIIRGYDYHSYGRGRHYDRHYHGHGHGRGHKHHGHGGHRGHGGRSGLSITYRD